jgi:hypothetical protein
MEDLIMIKKIKCDNINIQLLLNENESLKEKIKKLEEKLYQNRLDHQCFRDITIKITHARIDRIEEEKCLIEDKINKVKDILLQRNGVADNQEFGLTYGQAINYLEQIEEIVKG